jgi:hypothetical protein
MYLNRNFKMVASPNTLHESITSRKVINESLSNHFILGFKLECLSQALENMADKSRIRLDLISIKDSNFLLFTVIIFKFCYSYIIKTYYNYN